MVVNSLETLLVHELRTLYNGQTHLVQVYNELVDEVTNDELRSYLADHLMVTREQGERIEECAEAMDFDPGGVKCHAIDGITREIRKALDDIHDEDARDAWVLLGLQKVEHYEICGYGAVSAWSEMLDRQDVTTLMKASVAEAKEADERLKTLAKERVNRHAQRA